MPRAQTLALLPLTLALSAASGQPAAVPAQPAPITPSAVPGLNYDTPFFPGAHHDPAIPTPDSILGFPVGQRAATHAQIEACLKAWASAGGPGAAGANVGGANAAGANTGPRCKLFEYAKTYEGRSLYYLAISSPDNIRQLDRIKADMAKLADPRKTDAAEADRLTDTLPAVAWMAYVIHGDEMSGSDAALASAYHLIAGQDDDVKALLDNLVILIDPLMNPDGRDRWLKQQAENRTTTPSLDDQSLLHTGSWPYGRTNHYFFDLNRDWILGIHPESRGRIAAAGEWHPQLLLESHEQEPQNTFLFSPPRAPFSPHLPKTLDKWYDRFAKDNAAAFDKFGWRYYTGEWNEGWYPGYSGSWAAYRGAVESLYEQARIQVDAVRRAEGVLDTYRESVHRQLVATFANLNTLRAGRKEILKDYLAQRRENVAENGPYAQRTFAISPGTNPARLAYFIDKLTLQGLEVYTAKDAFTASGKDQLGREVKGRQFPAGTILVPNRQPEARLLAEMLEFDPRMAPAFLQDERRELLRFDRSKMYDVTAWNLTMLHGLEACELTAPLPASAERYTAAAGPGTPPPPAPGIDRSGALMAYLINGDDDRSVAAAARLMERGVQLRIATKPFEFDGKPFARGSVVVARIDNRNFAGEAGGHEKVLAQVCAELGLRAIGVDNGLSPGDLPDIGGEYFPRLQPPTIAVLAREPFDAYSYGEVWFTLDHELGIRASYLDANTVSGADLRRYNVLVVPSADGDPLKPLPDSLKAWVQNGGTLIAIGSSAGALANEKAGYSAVRLLPDVLTKLDQYDLAVQREWLGMTATIDPEAVWSYGPSAAVAYPWPGGKPDEKTPEKPSDDELKKRDKWQSRFMPQGAILAARADDQHWLTFGCAAVMPVLYFGDNVLMSAGEAQAPVRLGAFVPAPIPAVKAEPPPPGKEKEVDKKDKAAAPAGDKKDEDQRAGAKNEPDHKGGERQDGKKADDGKIDDKKDDDKKDNGKKDDDKKDDEPKPAPRATWAGTPEGYELRLRMSGLLWPEAAQRLANSAYVTREGVGQGQVILFAASPTWRGSTRGTARLLTNAMIYGPGLGASHPILP